MMSHPFSKTNRSKKSLFYRALSAGVAASFLVMASAGDVTAAIKDTKPCRDDVLRAYAYQGQNGVRSQMDSNKRNLSSAFRDPFKDACGKIDAAKLADDVISSNNSGLSFLKLPAGLTKFGPALGDFAKKSLEASIKNKCADWADQAANMANAAAQNAAGTFQNSLRGVYGGQCLRVNVKHLNGADRNGDPNICEALDEANDTPPVIPSALTLPQQTPVPQAQPAAPAQGATDNQNTNNKGNTGKSGFRFW